MDAGWARDEGLIPWRQVAITPPFSGGQSEIGGIATCSTLAPEAPHLPQLWLKFSSGPDVRAPPGIGLSARGCYSGCYY